MPSLEKASWIAGILSTVLTVVGVAWGVWNHFRPPATPLPGAPDVTFRMDPSALKQMENDTARNKRFMEAWEAANYAQGNVTRALTDKENKAYAAAHQKLRDAMHLAEIGGRDEEALQLYREARELFERLR